MVVESRVDLKVVDADGHYLEPEDLSDYIDPKWKDVAPRTVTLPDGSRREEGRQWFAEAAPQFGPPPGFQRATEEQQQTLSPTTSRNTQPSLSAKDRTTGAAYNQRPPGVLDSPGRLKVMDKEGIDAAFLYPTKALAWIPEGPFHQALNEALNDWLADWISVDRQRLMGVANIVAIHDVEWAVGELRRCVEEHGYRAAFLRSALPNAEVRWWDQSYDPFWAACQELDVAVGFHPFAGDTMYGSARYFDIIGPTSVHHLMRVPFNHVVDSMETMMGLIAGGVCERFPELRMGILESSGGWLPTFLERLDSRFEYLHAEVPHLKLKPSDYFRRNWWISFDPEEAILKPTAEWLGADRIIWGSDFPHPDAFYPGFVTMLNDNIGELSDREQEQIRAQNAKDFYKI